MFAIFFTLALFAFAQTYAQTAGQINCGKVEIPPLTPAQLLNPLSWTLPGQVAASNCYTGFLVGSSQALNDMYNAMYNAGRPSAVSGVSGASGISAGVAASVPSRVSSRSKSKKNNNGKSKKENESGKKNKDSKKEASGKKQ